MDPGKHKIEQLSYYSFKKRAAQRVSRACAPADVAAEATFRRPSAPRLPASRVHGCAPYTEDLPREAGRPPQQEPSPSPELALKPHFSGV